MGELQWRVWERSPGAPSASSSASAQRLQPKLFGVLLGLVGSLTFAVNVIGVGVPDPWRDEAATWSATHRSVGQLLSLLRSVDAVHGFYYLVLREWSVPFGSSVLSLRAFSVLGVAVGAILVTLLVRRLWGDVPALWAGASYGLFPVVSWAATEARSYAWAAAAATAVVLMFFVAVESPPGWARWLAYAATVALATHLFLYLALVPISLLAALAWCKRGSRLPALIATAAGLGAAVPFVALAARQTSQIDWLGAYRPTVTDVVARPLWGTTPIAQAAGTALMVLAIVVAIRDLRRPASRGPVVGLLSWLVVPSALLLASGPVISLYVPRYAIVSVPAAATLLGLLFARARFRWTQAIIFVVIALVGVMPFIAARQPTSKASPSAAMALIAAGQRPGDRLYIVGNDGNALAWSYPQIVNRMVVVGQQHSGWQDQILHRPSVPTSELGQQLRRTRRIWVFAYRDAFDDALAGLSEQGFREVSRTLTKNAYWVILLRR